MFLEDFRSRFAAYSFQNEILNGHVFEGVYALSVEVNGKPSYIKGLQG